MKLRKIGKKGALLDIIVWIIIGFMTILILGTFVYSFDVMTNAMTSIESEPGQPNISKHAESTFGQVNAAMPGGLGTVAFVIIFMMAFSIFISNFLVKAHPVFFIVHVFITVLAFIFSVEVSNAYEGLMSNEVLGSTLQTSFKGASFIMLHLPTWVVVIGIGGAIFLFVGIMRDRGLGGSVPL